MVVCHVTTPGGTRGIFQVYDDRIWLHRYRNISASAGFENSFQTIMPPKGSTIRRKAPADGTITPQSPSLAEQFSYLHSPRPFKNPHYTKNINRRARNLKNVLAQERERERAERERRRLEKGDGMDVDGEDDVPTYTSIEAPPSLMPQKHYCDITGLEAPYTDPATGLRYHDKSVYEIIKNLSPSTVKEYLSARGVHAILK